MNDYVNPELARMTERHLLVAIRTNEEILQKHGDIMRSDGLWVSERLAELQAELQRHYPHPL